MLQISDQKYSFQENIISSPLRWCVLLPNLWITHGSFGQCGENAARLACLLEDSSLARKRLPKVIS